MLGLAAAAIAALSVATVLPASAGSDQVRVVDATRLEVGGNTYRLYGIVAPRPGEICTIAGRQRDCGTIAKAALSDLVAGAKVRCQAWSAAARTYRCEVGGFDLSWNMAYVGWALAEEGAPAAILAAEATARQRDHGLWRASPPPSRASFRSAE
jgi:endonuclease YncB( thermonuclease family)